MKVRDFPAIAGFTFKLACMVALIPYFTILWLIEKDDCS